MEHARTHRSCCAPSCGVRRRSPNTIAATVTATATAPTTLCTCRRRHTCVLNRHDDTRTVFGATRLQRTGSIARTRRAQFFLFMLWFDANRSDTNTPEVVGRCA